MSAINYGLTAHPWLFHHFVAVLIALGRVVVSLIGLLQLLKPLNPLKAKQPTQTRVDAHVDAHADTHIDGHVDAPADAPTPDFTPFDQGARGVLYGAQQLLTDWGFKLEDVKGEVHWYHGNNDTNVPPHQARYVAQRLPGCVYEEYDADHFTILDRLDEMLGGLVP